MYFIYYIIYKQDLHRCSDINKNNHMKDVLNAKKLRHNQCMHILFHQYMFNIPIHLFKFNYIAKFIYILNKKNIIIIYLGC